MRDPSVSAAATVFTIVSAAFGTLAPLAAQEAKDAPEELVSGPPPASPLAPVKVYAATGPHAGKEFDAVQEIGVRPGALLFVHELSRNTAPVIRGFDELAEEYGPLGLCGFAVLLHGDRTSAEERIKTVSGAIAMTHPMVVSLDGIDGPGGFALNRKCTLTLVTAKEGKVVRSVAYKDTGRQDLPRLRELLEEVAGSPREAYRVQLPQDPEALREHAVELALELHVLKREVRELRRELERYRQQGEMAGERGGRAMRRSAEVEPGPQGRAGEASKRARPQQGRAPEDPELRTQLRRVISKFASKEEIDAAFGEIDKRVGEDDELGKQSIEMFRLMLSLDYGSDHAKAKAKAYLEARGVPFEPDASPEKEKAAGDEDKRP